MDNGMAINAEAINYVNLVDGAGRLVMPPYQRSYQWGEQEATDLLSDLEEVSQTGGCHFIGSIVLIKSNADSIFEIVDGQQRLSTLTMILCVLRDLEVDEDAANEIEALLTATNDGQNIQWRLNLNQTDGPFFHRFIQLSNNEFNTELPEDISDSQRRLWNNFEVIRSVLQSRSLLARRALLETIKRQCQIVRVVVNSREEGYRVFRVLNTRGREPNTHDIIKTDLLEQARFSREKVNLIAEQWTEYEARLGDIGFDALLRQIRMLYGKSTRGNFVTGFRKSVLADTSAAQFLEDKLPRYVRAFDRLSRSEVAYGDASEGISRSIYRLSMLEHQGWQMPALKFLYKKDSTPQTATAFFRDLERLAYIIQLVVHDRDQRSKRYRAVLGDVNASFDFGGTTPSSLAISPDDAKRLKSRLLGRFAAFRQRRTLAFLLNDILPNGEFLKPDADATIEHVLPRNPAPASSWMQTWPNARSRRDLCDTLGNFVLLTHRANQRADRKAFSEKKSIYFSDQDGSVKFALTRDIKNTEVWTADLVRMRTERFTRLLLDYWRL